MIGLGGDYIYMTQTDTYPGTLTGEWDHDANVYECNAPGDLITHTHTKLTYRVQIKEPLPLITPADYLRIAL